MLINLRMKTNRPHEELVSVFQHLPGERAVPLPLSRQIFGSRTQARVAPDAVFRPLMLWRTFR